MQDTEAIFSEVRRLVTMLGVEERLALIRDIVTAPFAPASPSPSMESSAGVQVSEQTSVDSASSRRAQMQAEQNKWYARPDEERNQYIGSYVALADGGNVVDHDPDRRTLYLRVRQAYGNQPIPIIPAERTSTPEFVIRRPKLVR